MSHGAKCGRGWGHRCAASQSPKCRCRCGGHNHGNPKARPDFVASNRELTPHAVFEGRIATELASFAKYATDIVCSRDDEGRAVVNIGRQYVVHSPDGFEWGYGGSGPADLALNIAGLFVDAPTAWRLHQDLKSEYVARLPREGGTIHASEISGWITVRLKALLHDQYIYTTGVVDPCTVS